MKTLTEIEREENDQRERAARYEKFKNGYETATKTLAKLEAQAADTTTDTLLQEILERVERLPKDLLTVGSRFVPGGCELRTVAILEFTGARAHVVAQNNARQNAINAARNKQAEFRALLKQFENEK